MTLVDRFICRREGHIPSFTIKKVQGIEVKSIITTCQRCGKVYEVSNQENRPDGAT